MVQIDSMVRSDRLMPMLSAGPTGVPEGAPCGFAGDRGAVVGDGPLTADAVGDSGLQWGMRFVR